MPALADKRVRQAFGYASDHQRITDRALYGLGRPTSIACRGSRWRTTRFRTRRTRTISPGRVICSPLPIAGRTPRSSQAVNTANPPIQTIAEILQQHLASVGAKLEIQKLDNAQFTSHIPKRDFGSAWIATIGGMNLSPATLFAGSFRVRVPNTSHFETPRYKQLIEQAYSQTDDQRLKGTLNSPAKLPARK